jgi:hypothetical protein
MRQQITTWMVIAGLALACAADSSRSDDPAPLQKAFIDGDGPGWVALGEADFVHVNCDPDTWTFKGNEIHCTGTPVGVIRSAKPYKNLELVVEWRHLKPAGNSGVFLWGSEESLTRLANDPKDRLPDGIEVQILDHAYATNYKEKTGKEPPYSFGTNGDVFPTGPAKMTPFPPTSPNGARAWPRKHLSKGSPEWNHYYVRAINGEVRLWVNGEEVTAGKDCDPASGFLCLESEGSPIEFRNLRIRELP